VLGFRLRENVSDGYLEKQHPFKSKCFLKRLHRINRVSEYLFKILSIFNFESQVLSLLIAKEILQNRENRAKFL
jgi:hypothetical protein